ncbi:MAG: DUF1330 domain-containing protein [Steroidobacteraceae bacterium]
MYVEDDEQSVLAALPALSDDTPIALLNLLRFRSTADVGGVEVSGRAAFDRYSELILPAIRAAKARPVFIADVATMLIAPPDERWDAVAIVLYPRRAAFESVLKSSEYLANAHLRTAALDDSRLMLLTAPRVISRAAWQAYGAVTGLGRLRRGSRGSGT